MRWYVLSILVFGALVLLSGCGSQQPVVADLLGEKISRGEFEAKFAKNNGGWEAAQKSTAEDREKFLDLYVKYKLKVREAYNRGYDRDPDVQAELNGYRTSLSVQFMLDRELTAPAVKKMFDRRLTEMRVSHILIRMPENPIPEDTLVSYNIAKGIIDSLHLGYSFEDLALHNSQDPSVQNNKGDVYYFTAGTMVPEFEDAVFPMDVGDISQYPIRTQFGYHIVKVSDKRQNRGAIRVSHIMKRLSRESTSEDTAKAMHDLQMALDSLKHGADFAQLAASLSDDKSSSERGGDIGFIERRRTVQPFDEAAFKLNVGEISGIVKTPFGVHVIKVTDAKPIPPFKELEGELKSTYQQYRYTKDFEKFVVGLKKQYNFTVNDDAIAVAYLSADTNKTTSDPNWDSSFTDAGRKKILFNFAGEKVTLDSVFKVAKTNPELRGLQLKNKGTLSSIFDKVGKTMVVEYRARGLETRMPEFAQIMKEYEEGILLFKAEQAEVWNKVVTSDSALRAYYQANRSKYTWPDRVNVQEIFVPTDSLAKIVAFLVKKQKFDFDSVAAQYNVRAATKGKNGEWGKLPVATNDLTTRAWTMKEGTISDFFPYEGGFSMIKVLERDYARDKTFEEAASEISGAYQEYESKRLESEWYESLKKKYPVTIDREVLKTVFREMPRKEATP